MFEIEEMLGGAYTSKKKSVTRISTNVVKSFREAGWNHTFLQTHFKNLQDEMISGWQQPLFVDYYAKHLVQTTYQKLQIGRQHFVPISEVLTKCGIHLRIAKKTETALLPLIGHSYTYEQILDIAVEYVLGKFAPISPPSVHYFTESTRIMEWMPYANKELINLPYACNKKYTKSVSKLIEVKFTYPNTKLFFHTTNWKGAQSISQVLNRNISRVCLDFGYTPGFYTSKKVEDCLDWGEKGARRWSYEVAILVFQLPSTPPAHLQLKSFDSPDNEWKTFVSKSRDCEANNTMVLHADNTSDLIYGPMLANVNSYRSEGVQAHVPPKMQLASKSGKGDAFFHTHLKGILVFRKENK